MLTITGSEAKAAAVRSAGIEIVRTVQLPHVRVPESAQIEANAGLSPKPTRPLAAPVRQTPAMSPLKLATQV